MIVLFDYSEDGNVIVKTKLQFFPDTFIIDTWWSLFNLTFLIGHL